MKVGDLVRHKTFGHTGLILQVDPRTESNQPFDYLLIVWSDWPGLLQENNQTWTRIEDTEVISETGER